MAAGMPSHVPELNSLINLVDADPSIQRKWRFKAGGGSANAKESERATGTQKETERATHKQARGHMSKHTSDPEVVSKATCTLRACRQQEGHVKYL